MSTYDDWVVRFKTDTTALDKALEKVNKLRAAMNGLHGNPSGGTGRGQPDKPLQAITQPVTIHVPLWEDYPLRVTTIAL